MDHNSQETRKRVIQSLEKPICGCCGKEFRSKKALFGHMRSHPERSWRGIRPPSPKIQPSSSSSAMYERPSSSSAARTDVNGYSSSSSWSVTGRRGRKSNSASTTSVVSGLGEQIHEAVRNLLLFAKTYNNSAENKKNVDAINSRSDEGTPKRKLHLEADDDDDKVFRVRKIQKILKVKFSDLKTSHAQLHSKSSVPPKKYRCNLCHKAFPTPQALGGHKSSHTKPNKTRTMLLQTSSEFQSSSAETQGQEPGGGSASSNTYYLAGTFHMTNISSDGKGGNSNGTMEAQSGRRILDFDLNELPTIEDGEEIN